MFSAEERVSAIRKLMAFCAQPEFEGLHRAARSEFWPTWISELSAEDRRRVADLSEQSETAYLTWFAFDFDLTGAPPVDTFLEGLGDHLTPGERDYLARMRDSHPRLYEVVEVRLEEGLRLRDIWTGEQIWVRERTATRQLVRWDVMATRLMQTGEGESVIDGETFAYPVSLTAEMLRELRRAHRQFMRRDPGGDLRAFFKWIGPLFHEFWLDEVVLRPLPALITAERDPVVFARLVFDVRDRAALTSALAGHPVLEQHEEGTYSWLEGTAGTGTPRRSLGTFFLRGRRLVLEAMSKQRAERGRRLIEETAGKAVKYRSARYTEPWEAALRGSDVESARAIPPEVEEKLLGEFYEKHYRSWPDTPLPALGHRTPRRAARLKTLRPKVVALLKEFENSAERQRREGRPAYDFGWMWKELGLEEDEGRP